MRHFGILMVVLIVCSCKSKKPVKTETNWILTSKNVYKNTRTKEGYLDTTRITAYTYNNGVPVDSILILQTRNYDNKKLVTERFYKVDKSGPPKPIGEVVYTYDHK